VKPINETALFALQYEHLKESNKLDLEIKREQLAKAKAERELYELALKQAQEGDDNWRLPPLGGGKA